MFKITVYTANDDHASAIMRTALGLGARIEAQEMHEFKALPMPRAEDQLTETKDSISIARSIFADGRVHTAKEIDEALQAAGYSRKSGSNALYRMMNMKLVKRVSLGRYQSTSNSLAN